MRLTGLPIAWVIALRSPRERTPLVRALEQLKRLVDVKFDPAAWISTTSTIVGGGMDLTMADVDDYLTGSG